MAIKGGPISRFVAIYALSDPRTDEIRYVGKTGNPSRRLAGHMYESRRHPDFHKSRWIRQLAGEGVKPRLVVLEWVAEDGWEVAERRWIAQFENLTNLASGGAGCPSVAKSDEHRANLRAARARQVMPPMSDETKAKLSAHWTGKKKPASQVEAQRLARQGERCYNARLTEADVLAIRAEVAGGSARSAVATKYDISYSTVTDIVLRRRWAHLAQEEGAK